MRTRTRLLAMIGIAAALLWGLSFPAYAFFTHTIKYTDPCSPLHCVKYHFVVSSSFDGGGFQEESMEYNVKKGSGTVVFSGAKTCDVGCGASVTANYVDNTPRNNRSYLLTASAIDYCRTSDGSDACYDVTDKVDGNLPYIRTICADGRAACHTHVSDAH